MARVCSRSGCVNIPNRPVPPAQPANQPYVVGSGNPPPSIAPSTPPPGTSGLRREDVDAFIRQQEARPARLLLEQGQPLPPQLQQYEAEARRQMGQPASVPLPQETTIAQKMQNFGNASTSFDPIEQYYKQQFATETIPSLAERFTGSKESSAFTGALGSAASQLNTNLAALRSQYDMALRDQMIKMAALGGGQGAQQGQATPTWYQTLANVLGYATPALAEAAGFIPGVGPIARAGISGLGNYLRSSASAVPNQQSYSGASLPTESQANLLSSRISSGYATPQDIQRFQAATGLGGSAATDFANTFRQPGSQSAMMGQNLDKFKRFTNASPGSALQYLGIRS